MVSSKINLDIAATAIMTNSKSSLPSFSYTSLPLCVEKGKPDSCKQRGNPGTNQAILV